MGDHFTVEPRQPRVYAAALGVIAAIVSLMRQQRPVYLMNRRDHLSVLIRGFAR
jgi:hypothetical protein